MIEVLYKDLSFNFNNTNYTILKITCSRWAIFISETTNCLNQTLHVSSGSDSGWGEYVIKQNDPGLSQVLWSYSSRTCYLFFLRLFLNYQKSIEHTSKNTTVKRNTFNNYLTCRNHRRCQQFLDCSQWSFVFIEFQDCSYHVSHL
jgi:hypothetical protein